MPLCNGGAAGVVVFFLISGYIITHVLQKETTGDFLLKRFFRIYPLYMFAVITEACLNLIVNGIALPSLSIWAPRLLLVGDFFHTDYALAGVEWTLRIEVMFYAFMAALKSLGIIERPAFLPAFLVLCTILLHVATPFPHLVAWSYGYLTLYGPFLFIGVIIYLIEHRKSNIQISIFSIAVIFYMFLTLISKIQPNWKDSNYAAFAILIFLATWLLKDKITSGATIKLISSMTYSVYLFHKWSWQYLTALVNNFGTNRLPINAQVFFILLVVCYTLHIVIEKHGINFGKRAIGTYWPTMHNKYKRASQYLSRYWKAD